jgi:hypothetical protein
MEPKPVTPKKLTKLKSKKLTKLKQAPKPKTVTPERVTTLKQPPTVALLTPKVVLNPNAKPFYPRSTNTVANMQNQFATVASTPRKFTPKQEPDLAKLFRKSLPKPRKQNKHLPVYYTSRRTPTDRFQVQRMRQYKSIQNHAKQQTPAWKGKRGWNKNQEGWTEIKAKHAQMRRTEYQGLRYKGSKMFRDPIPKKRGLPYMPTPYKPKRMPNTPNSAYRTPSPMRPQRLFPNSGSPNQRPSRQFPQNQARRVTRSYGCSPIWISPHNANSGRN